VFGFGGIRRTVGVAMVGAVVTAFAPVVVAAPALATDGCTGAPSVLVNGGAAWTRRSLVELRVTVPSGATEVEIANAPDFSDARLLPLSPSCRYGWRLDGDPAVAMRTVHVRFPGTAAPAVADRVWVDADEPVVVRADATWSNRRGGWVLHTRAIDLGSGPAWFQTSRRNGSVRRTHPRDRTVVTWDRSVIERVRFADRLGNRTGWVRVRFLS
jgi:hypothetical protein